MQNRIGYIAVAMLAVLVMSLWPSSGSAQTEPATTDTALSEVERSLSIDSSVDLANDGRQLTILGDGVCETGAQMFDLRVRMAQGETHAFTEARHIDLCREGERQTWAIEAATESRNDFVPGPVTVCAQAQFFGDFGASEEIVWCQSAELIATPSTSSPSETLPSISARVTPVSPASPASPASPPGIARRDCPLPFHLNGDCDPIREPPIPTPTPPVITPEPPRAPDAPTNLSVDNPDIDSIRIRWVDNSDNEAGFTLWFRAQGEDWDTVRAWYHGGEPGRSTGEQYEYIHRDLQSNTEYCYQVGVWNEHGSNSSDVQCTQTLPDPPDAADLSIRFVQHDTVGIDVLVHSHATSMRVYHREESDSNWRFNFSAAVHVNDLPTRVFNRAARNLEPATAYCLRVILLNNGIEGPPSNEECVETLNPPPLAPTHFRAIDVTDSTVTLEWRDRTQRQGRYELRRYDRQGTDDAEFDLGSQGGLVTFTDTGLKPDNEYAYWLWVFSEDNRAVSETVVEIRTEAGNGDDTGFPALLFVGSLHLSPTFPGRFEPFTITWVACNAGTVETGRFTDMAQLNQDITIRRSIDSLAAGECYEESAQHEGLPPGYHEWIVYLDVDQDVQEFRNSNRYGFIIPE